MRDFSFRDLYLVFEGAREREKELWRGPMLIAQSVMNWGGPRGERFQPKGLSWLYDKHFGKDIDVESARSAIDRAKAALKERE